MYKSFNFTTACKQRDYLLQFCENIFKENNFKEEPAFKGMPERMAYEPEIWIIGSDIIQKLKETKNNKADYSLLLEGILKVINTEKYDSGRQSFVMTLHYFKNNLIAENCLTNLLDDKQLYGFAIKEMNKSKLYGYTNKVEQILNNEKTTWIKKEAERYIKNSPV